MDILAKTVDADVMQKFVGLQCDFQGCGKQIDGYVDELKAHYSYFFFKNGGKERGLHTGIIQSHCHHLQTKIKPEDREAKKTDACRQP
ncbi:hypothetical protein pipiens_002315 [Culex pipiens pipiens]|uniref:Uncharacterized protein n=1 Tax=Culex pipiens pipiens TaxID=38569 RepID=A0ABD1DGR1_CULPP